jgi:peptidyl-tRNA hydrolase
MNQSGVAIVKAFRAVNGEEWGQLCIVHDDMELPVGSVKVQKMGKGRYVLK